MKETWNKLLGLSPEESSEEEVQMILLELVTPNPYQPRKVFDPERIEELAQSIKTYGLLQPVIVRRHGNKYQLVAGERRYLACLKLGWSRIPAIVKDYNDSSMGAIALIENLQRENLNFMEEAEGLERLLNEFGLTQEVLAQRLGKSQSTIANKLRLLKLPPEVKQYFKDGSLTERHARALLKIADTQKQLEIIKTILDKELNVKQTENLVDSIGGKKGNNNRNKSRVIVKDLRIFLNTIRQAVETIKKAGLIPRVYEKDCGEYYEVRICLPKRDG
ncbi:MAG TPA: nucleoid occlusion protein [Firmicutes bacterium]|nr:nucleoid occlusion protein [Bacillota bacterium]